MAITHTIAGGMGGIRAAGDLVARMQLSRHMRIDQAKEYVANKLHVSVKDLCDPVVMGEIRDQLKLGLIEQKPGRTRGMEAKFHIAEVLGIEINSVNKFKQKVGLPVSTP